MTFIYKKKKLSVTALFFAEQELRARVPRIRDFYRYFYLSETRILLKRVSV